MEQTVHSFTSAPALTEELKATSVSRDEPGAASLYAWSLIEASLDPMVTISPQGKITDVNEPP
ncbi:MAG: hypothetical protein ABSF52_17590 [Syntrophobacteraceae bacterium]